MATILVVDDRDLNRNVLTTLLGYGGHRLLEASNGPEGLTKVQAESPELIITDILMPDMDGYEFVRKVRALPIAHQPRIVFYSATYLENEALALARACGVNRVICKPAEPEQVLKAVNEMLALSAGENAPTIDIKTQEGEAVRVLSNKLYQKVKELEALNSELERRVAERTSELEQTNRSLQLQITERQKAETEAAKSNEERLRMKGEFLSHVSHELRSPLGVVHQFTTILLDELAGPLSPDQREYLEISLRNINQLKCMIDDLLEASRADVGKLTLRRLSISIREVIEQSTRSQKPIAARKNIVLKTEVADNLPLVYADPARVLQILTNLLDNSIKFGRPKTAISLRAQTFENAPHFVCVSVADCGCGIKREEADRIFDRLYQAKNSNEESRRGLGLGLYICKQLVDLHGGSIWLETKPGVGSTFYFTVPVFTIENMIGPLLAGDGRLAPSLALLTVRVAPTSEWRNETHRERALHGIHQLLQRCVLPDVDVLLPVENCTGSDLFAIVARADVRGAQALLSRIREQVSRCDDARNAQIRFSLDSKVFSLAGLVKDLPPERCAAHVGTYLQELLEQAKTGANHDEQPQDTPH